MILSRAQGYLIKTWTVISSFMFWQKITGTGCRFLYQNYTGQTAISHYSTKLVLCCLTIQGYLVSWYSAGKQTWLQLPITKWELCEGLGEVIATRLYNLSTCSHIPKIRPGKAFIFVGTCTLSMRYSPTN